MVEWGIYGDWCPALEYSTGGDGTHSAQVTPQFMAGAYNTRSSELTEKRHTYSEKRRTKRNGVPAASGAKRHFPPLSRRFTGVIGSGSQTECAVAMTVFPEERALCAGWAKRAAEDIAARGYHMTCGNQGYRHLLYRLAEYGHGETLIKLLQNREYPGWGYMLEKGATTVWERWESDVATDMHSFDHPMFAGYDGFLYNYVAGIRTEECAGAFGDIVVQPLFPSSLTSAQAELAKRCGAGSVPHGRGRGIRSFCASPRPGTPPSSSVCRACCSPAAEAARGMSCT